ncbi:hypothetical protein B0H16DRAFT_1566917 [Mycena metata]|uniref:Uncharacterized protein n=1 Tax=Mycena metata TaxID=1033252 RepID=A0AAD7N0L2_9AGAR|nr:hypothetical protein B0H16DRAFT_1566917 [Mycena metata]
MNHQVPLDVSPFSPAILTLRFQSGVPTSVLDFRASQVPAQPPNPGVSPHTTLLARQPAAAQPEQQAQAASSSQPAPQFASEGRVASTQRPAAYSHGYPTPPSHLAALSPVNDPHAQSRPNGRPLAMDPSGPSQPQRRHSASSHANHVPYPTPPTRSTALSPDQQQQRMPMMQPPPHSNAFAHAAPGHGQPPYYPPPPSQLPPAPTDPMASHPHPSHASAPQQQYAHFVSFPHHPPAQPSMPRGGPPPQPMPAQRQTSLPDNARHVGVQPVVPTSQQRPMPSSHASTSHQGPPPPVPYPQEHHSGPSNYSTSLHPSQLRASTSALPFLPPPPHPHGPGNGGELPILDSPEYVEELKRQIKFHEEERTRLVEAARKFEEQYVAHARNQAEFIRQATEKNNGLRAERDAALGERDAVQAECHRLRHQRGEARDEAARNALMLGKVQMEGRTAIERLQKRVQELEQTVQKWRQVGRAQYAHGERLKGERDELKARVQRLEREAAAVVPKVEGVDKKAPDALITPKSEPIDDIELELQYPPDEPGSQPIAGPSTSFPDDASTLYSPNDALSTLYSAGPSTSPSTFIAWELPPSFEQPEDRKRTREEYEGGTTADADDQARPAVRPRLEADAPADEGFSLGPAFPLPRDVSLGVGAMNSPVRYFTHVMEVRRKAGGSG